MYTLNHKWKICGCLYKSFRLILKMNTNVIKGLIFFVFVASTTFGQDSKDAACRSLVKCLSDADSVRKQCDQQRAAIGDNQNKKPASSSDDCSTIGAKNEALQTLVSQQKQQQRDCLTSSFADATPVGDKKKQDECQKTVADYQQQPGANANIGASADINTNLRSKRQASGNASVSATAAAHGSGGGPAPNSNGPAPGSKGPGSSSNPAPGSAGPAPSAGGPAPGAGGPASSTRGPAPGANGAANGSGGPAPGIVPPKASAGEAKANGTSNANKAGAAQLKQCFQEAESKQKQCRELHSCCSEVTPCEFKYQLSPLHDQIFQAQLDLFNLRRRCQQQQQQKNQKGSAGQANGNGNGKGNGSGNGSGNGPVTPLINKLGLNLKP